MQQINLGAAQNSASIGQKLPKGVGSAMTISSDAGNTATAVVVGELSFDDGTTYVPLAWTDMTSTTPTTKIANLTGPSKAVQNYMDGCQDVLWRVRRTDATGGACIVWVGITTTSIN